MNETPIPDTRYSRLPGVLWFLAALAGGFGLGYMRSAVIVPDDAAATIANLHSSEFLYRLAMASTLVSQVLMVFFVIELFRIFQPVNRRLVMIMMVSFVLSAAFAAINTINYYAAILVLNQAEFLRGFTTEQITSLSYFLMRIANGPGQGVIELFWPSAYATFGLLIIRSRALPPLFGYLLLIAAAGFTINLVDKYLFPWFYPLRFTQAAQITAALTILPTMLWFLIRGVRRAEC